MSKKVKQCEECGDRTKEFLVEHPTKPGKWVCEMCLDAEFSVCKRCGRIYHHPWIDSDNLDPEEAICDDCLNI